MAYIHYGILFRNHGIEKLLVQISPQPSVACLSFSSYNHRKSLIEDTGILLNSTKQTRRTNIVHARKRKCKQDRVFTDPLGNRRFVYCPENNHHSNRLDIQYAPPQFPEPAPFHGVWKMDCSKSPNPFSAEIMPTTPPPHYPAAKMNVHALVIKVTDVRVGTARKACRGQFLQCVRLPYSITFREIHYRLG